MNADDVTVNVKVTGNVWVLSIEGTWGRAVFGIYGSEEKAEIGRKNYETKLKKDVIEFEETTEVEEFEVQ